MAQGTRGRLLMAAATGFGVVLCTGLVGCQNTDKSKDTKAVTKQPPPGLPGTQTLPPGTAASRTGMPTSPYGTAGTSGTSGSFGTGIQPAGGMQTSPAAGMGNGGGSGQFSSNGMNTLTSPAQNYGSPNPPRTPGNINAPAQPGMYTPPTGPVSTAPPVPGNALTSAAFSSPPPVSLVDMPIVPPPPPTYGPAGNAVASGAVPPPGVPSPLAPIPPPKPSGVNSSMGGGVGLFGGQ